MLIREITTMSSISVKPLIRSKPGIMVYWHATFNECPKMFYGFINIYTLMKIGGHRRKESVQL